MSHPEDAERDERRQENEPAPPETAPLAVSPDRHSTAGESRPETDSLEAELPEDALIVLPASEAVLFPGIVVSLSVEQGQTLDALQEAVRREVSFGIVLQRNAEAERPTGEELHRVGTLASLVRYYTAMDGSHLAVCRGQKRFEVVDYYREEPFLVARVRYVEEKDPKGEEIEARMMSLRQLAKEALDLAPQPPPGLKETLQGMTSPSVLADFIGNALDLSAAEKQEILETFDVESRLARVGELLAQQFRVMKLAREISEQTRGTLDKAQKEHYLREQLRTIQKELGEEDARAVEIEELSRKIGEAGMPEDVEKEARKELARFERMPEGAMESSMIRTFLEWMTELPWSKTSGDQIDVAHARQILDEDHYDLDKIKKRILEFLAVRKLRPEGKSPILCLVGPPGVGKTSLGRSVARAMGRKFIRIGLGGVHDEAEIRGHRRTYVGSMPGNIIQGIRRAGARDPVFMLDEIDKMSASFHGDPYSALLEVLDPEQNSSFRDNYLGVSFDLSRVFFIATANMLDSVPAALRDRLEVIPLSGYTVEEKLEIARRYIVRRQIEASGLTAEQIEFTTEALAAIITGYTREAGCRKLEQKIGAICRSVAVEVAEGAEERKSIGAREVQEILGASPFENEVALRTSVSGVATGLAWTPVGGDLLFVEATRMPGKGQLILTGKLGEVMKESGRAALSLAQAVASDLDIPHETLQSSDIHIHVPAGAIPKDGPSAGVTMYVAVVSLLTGRKVRADVAMTGEISLRGLVLPVGGIKEKVLAAHAAGIRSVILPARNRKDAEEIPESVHRDLRFVWVETVAQVLRNALMPTDTPTETWTG